MASETLTPNTLALPAGNADPAALAASENRASPSSRLPGWLQAKDGPGALVTDLLRQPSVRKALPFLVIFMLLVSVAVFFTSLKPTPYRPLVMMLSDTDKQAAVEALKAADFKPEIDQGSGQISVPTARYQEARMLLASQGLPKGAVAGGLDSLKGQSAMTTSQFMEQARYSAAIEQELARSITQIGTIQGARVHLAQTRQSAFVRDRTPVKASVVVTQPKKVRMLRGLAALTVASVI